MKNLNPFLPFLAFACLGLASCSHRGEQVDAQAAAATAKVNADKKGAAILDKAGDYNAEIRYAATKLPASPEQKAITEIAGLQEKLTGDGSANEQAREAFVDSIIKDDLKAHRDLYQAGQDDIKLKADKQAADVKADKATAKSNAMAIQAASAWDSLSWLQNYAIFAVVALLVIYAIHLFIVYGKAAGTVAAKLP